MRRRRVAWLVVLGAALLGLLAPGGVWANPGTGRLAGYTPGRELGFIAPARLGVNFGGSPPDLSLAAGAGVGLARTQVLAGEDTDALVGLTAAAGLRLYPTLGLPHSHGPALDAAAMALFVTWFARRYGVRGSFWAEHPRLAYLPVQSFEIGNEPDIGWPPADGTSLHYARPADFALVYETARSALHRVDPHAIAVIGGLLDSSAVPLSAAEGYLRAIGPMDAVGYHPYLYNERLMEQHTLELRRWLDRDGHAAVPIDIDEFGIFPGLTSLRAWGAAVSDYSQWALCTRALRVEDVQPFWWGAVPGADSSHWFTLVHSNLIPTRYGSAYLDEAAALTRSGCPSLVKSLVQ